MNKLLLIGVLILVLGGGIYFFSSKKAPPAKDENTNAMEVGNNSKDATEKPGQNKELIAQEEVDYTLNMQNFSFTPNVMKAKAGQTLKVKIVNGGGFHDLVIDELGVQSGRISEGEEEIVEIPIPEDATGEYEFYCSVGNHRALGMFGTLTIGE